MNINFVQMINQVKINYELIENWKSKSIIIELKLPPLNEQKVTTLEAIEASWY